MHVLNFSRIAWGTDTTDNLHTRISIPHIEGGEPLRMVKIGAGSHIDRCHIINPMGAGLLLDSRQPWLTPVRLTKPLVVSPAQYFYRVNTTESLSAFTAYPLAVSGWSEHMHVNESYTNPAGTYQDGGGYFEIDAYYGAIPPFFSNKRARQDVSGFMNVSTSFQVFRSVIPGRKYWNITVTDANATIATLEWVLYGCVESHPTFRIKETLAGTTGGPISYESDSRYDAIELKAKDAGAGPGGYGLDICFTAED